MFMFFFSYNIVASSIRVKTQWFMNTITLARLLEGSGRGGGMNLIPSILLFLLPTRHDCSIILFVGFA